MSNPQDPSIGALAVSILGGASVVLAAFVLCLDVFHIPFRDIQLAMVLFFNVGFAAIALLVIHLVLSIVPRWRHRTTLWVIAGWLVLLLAFWLHNL